MLCFCPWLLRPRAGARPWEAGWPRAWAWAWAGGGRAALRSSHVCPASAFCGSPVPVPYSAVSNAQEFGREE